jgi:nucleotide-binding universal stress UspA family protein
MKAKPTKHPGEVVLELNRRDELLLAAAGRDPATSPFRLKRILVPIDFSDCSKKALRYALPLARQHEATITLLYVAALPAYYAVGDGGGFNYASFEADYVAIEAEMRASGEKRLSALAADETHGEVETNVLVRTGSPTLEIIDLARSLPADLIVISTHGRTGLKHVWLGSVAEHVVRHAPCPVLVVREQEHEFVTPEHTATTLPT